MAPSVRPRPVLTSEEDADLRIGRVVLLASLPACVEALRRPLFVLRIVSAACAIRIRVVGAFGSASSIASAGASSTSRCRHGRDSITKGVSARSTNVNGRVAVHATMRFRAQRGSVSRWSCAAGRVGLSATGGCCEKATKAHRCREQESHG
jgi:hypothetical protein